MISLVVATFGRIREIRTLFSSLLAQTYQNFEVIVVDQNAHDEIRKICQEYAARLSIIYLKNEIKGLSVSRNIGLKHCHGSIVGFPDDDCFYDQNLLSTVVREFDSNIDFLAFSVVDPQTKVCYLHRVNCNIRRKDILKNCISINTFIRYSENYKFDENLGLGAPFPSGEETDFLWKRLQDNDIGHFINHVSVYHLRPDLSERNRRAYTYGLGFGAIFKKEIFQRKHYFQLLVFGMYLLRSIAGIFASNHSAFYWETLKGRIAGFYQFKEL